MIRPAPRAALATSLLELGNRINSLKSVCSFTVALPVLSHEVEPQVEPLGGRHLGVGFGLGVVGRGEIVEDSDGSVHPQG